MLWWFAVAHAAVALACLAWLAFDAAPVLGVHPAHKPLKFGLSIAVFLAAMAYLVPTLACGGGVARALAWTLALTMALEMAPILIQAIRGVPSHFNTRAPLDAGLWRLMLIAIVIATFTVLGIAVLATVRPLRASDGGTIAPLLATAWRVGLWFFVLAAFTGFRMGGQGRHSVGGDDGGPGLRLVNWSVAHGDLRIAHFVGLHALQALPLIALALGRAPVGAPARWAGLIAAIAAHLAVGGWTLLRALAGRPPW